LQNILAHAGIASRREAAKIIENGEVKVDGKVVLERGFRADISINKIEVNGKLIHGDQKKYHFLFYKPENVISTVKDTQDRRKIVDFFADVKARLYPVGRLDRNTTGLIIVTNDGDLTNKLTHPRYEIDKEYMVLAEEKLDEKMRLTLEAGIFLEDKKTSPAIIEFLKEEKNGYRYKVEIHEGQNRQIRRMFEEMSIRVRKLKRTKYAFLTLKGLKKGQYRKLTREEVERLRSICDGRS